MCKAVVQKDIIRSSDGDTPSAHWFFFAPRTMQIADFIIGLLGHLWLHFHHVWLLISFLTKKAGCRKELRAQLNEDDAHGLYRAPMRVKYTPCEQKQDHECRNGEKKVKINPDVRRNKVQCELLVRPHYIPAINLLTVFCKITPRWHFFCQNDNIFHISVPKSPLG